MLSNNVLSSIECAISHTCLKGSNPSDKCVQCEIGYSFIADEPRVLECGHHICKECIAKTESGNINCKICSKIAKYYGANGVAADSLFQLFQNDLAKELRDKFEATIKLYDGSENKLN